MNSSHKALLTRNILSSKELTSELVNAARQSLEGNAFVCIRGLIDPPLIAQVKAALHARFRPEADQKLNPGYPHLIRQNFQRLFIGGTSKKNVTRPRFLRTFYNPLSDRDIYGCHAIFRMLIRLRNQLYGLPPDFAGEKPEKGLWTAARIHHYPRGGGFMAPHRDHVLSEVAAEAGLNGYYQVMLLMSKKGLDYSEGGGYLETNGERLFFEESYEPADIVIYDGRMVHGVEEVDPQERLDLGSLAGRLAAFVSLYRFQD
jgi:hypothetical protein